MNSDDMELVKHEVREMIHAVEKIGAIIKTVRIEGAGFIYEVERT